MALRYAKTAGGNWSAAGTWSATGAGGVDDAGAPTAADEVIFELLSGNVTIDAAAACRSLDCVGGTGSYAGVLTHAAAVTLSIGDGTAGTGNRALRFSAGMTYTLGNATTSAIAFVSTSTTQQTITWAGKTCGNLTHTGVGGSWTPTDAVNSSGSFNFTNGVYNNSVNNVTHTVSTFSVGGTATRNINLGSATWNLTSTAAGTVYAISFGTGLTFSGDNATIVISTASSNLRTFSGLSQTYGALVYTVAGSTGGLNITGGNTFGVLAFSDANNARTLQFTAGTTTTISTAAGWQVNGGDSRLITIGSITAAGHTLSCSSGTISSNYLSISRSTAQGGASWYAGANSTDGGNNSGWLFSAPSSFVSGPLTSRTVDEVLSQLAGLTETQPAQKVIADRLGIPPTSKSVQRMLAEIKGVPPTSKSEQELWWLNISDNLGLTGHYTQFSEQELLNMAKNSNMTISQVLGQS